jgi:hypothetical protein
MIHFTTGHMVGETITVDDLVSVYQGGANAVPDEGTFRKTTAAILLAVHLVLLKPKSHRTQDDELLPAQMW